MKTVLFCAVLLTTTSSFASTCVPTKFYSMFSRLQVQVSNHGDHLKISNMVIGSKGADYPSNWPGVDVGTRFADHKYGKFSRLFNEAYWRVQVYTARDLSSVTLRWASTDGLFFSERYSCY